MPATGVCRDGSSLDQAPASLPSVKVGPDALKAQIAKTRNRIPTPAVVECTQRAVLSIAKSGLPPWLLSDIKHLASLHNPQFYERQRLRLSTFRVPRFIRSYREDLTQIHLPRGLLDELTPLMAKAGSRLSLKDDRAASNEISLSFGGELMEALERLQLALVGVVEHLKRVLGGIKRLARLGLEDRGEACHQAHLQSPFTALSRLDVVGSVAAAASGASAASASRSNSANASSHSLIAATASARPGESK